MLMIGLWVCAVTLGASYAAVIWQSGIEPDKQADEFFGGLDYVKIEPMSIPMVAGGEIKGYIIAQFVFTVDGTTLRKLSVPPTVFIVDEAYRAIYGRGQQIDFKRIERFKIEELTKQIAVKVNERFKADLVKDVLVERFDFVTKNEVRATPVEQPKRPAKSANGQGAAPAKPAAAEGGAHAPAETH